MRQCIAYGKVLKSVLINQIKLYGSANDHAVEILSGMKLSVRDFRCPQEISCTIITNHRGNKTFKFGKVVKNDNKSQSAQKNTND